MRAILGLFLLITGCQVATGDMLLEPATVESPLDTLMKNVTFTTNGTLCMTVRRADISDCPTNKRFQLKCIEEHVGKFSNNTPKGCGIFYMKSLEYCADKIPLDTKLKCRVIPVA